MTSTRRFSRVPFRVNATVKTADRQFYGNVENLSMCGMFLSTAERLPEGEPVEITIVLSGTSPELFVGFTGRVSRESEYGIAFSFEKIDLDSYTHLKNIIAHNSEDAEKVMEEIYHSINEKFTEEK
jgi:hypothetical protein